MASRGTVWTFQDTAERDAAIGTLGVEDNDLAFVVADGNFYRFDLATNTWILFGTSGTLLRVAEATLAAGSNLVLDTISLSPNSVLTVDTMVVGIDSGSVGYFAQSITRTFFRDTTGVVNGTTPYQPYSIAQGSASTWSAAVIPAPGVVQIVVSHDALSPVTWKAVTRVTLAP